MLGRLNLRVLLLGVTVAIAAGAGFWAGQQLNSTADTTELDVPQPITTTARTGTLGEEYPVAIRLEWTTNLSLPFLGETGILTTLNSEPEVFTSLESGTVIGTVNGEPIVVINGEHPAYRPMMLGITGVDVEQLQAHLVSTGLLASTDANGYYGTGTEHAVEAWWETLGIKERNTVPKGSIIFAKDMPRLLTTDPATRIGDIINMGTPLLTGISATPTITVRLTDFQAQRYLDVGATFWAKNLANTDVEMTVLGSEIREGTTEIQLAFPADWVDEHMETTVLPGQSLRLGGRMVVQPPTQGTIIPLAALYETAGSDATVRLADGTSTDVRIIASVGGLAVVKPLEPGTVVVVDQ